MMAGSKKKLALIMVLVLLLLLFSSCKKKDDIIVNNVTVTADDGQVISINRDSVFKLPCTRSDSFNPFFAEMLNNQTLMTLMYEPLFCLDDTFTAQPVLAQSCTIEKLTLTVRLKSGAKFSDGSAVTASDVVYSFRQAKEAPGYAANLAGLASAEATDTGTVVFTAAGSNVNAEMLLTFPVVKNGTGGSAGDLPVGSGRFVLKIDGTSYEMAPNGFYSKTPAITKIQLVNAESEEEIENALHIGNISFIFNDLSKGSKTSGNAKSTAVPLNNLVYIGFNPKNILGQSSNLRKAVSYAINREDIVSAAYHSFATEATSVFNPLWAGSAGTDVASIHSDDKAAELAVQSSVYGDAPLRLLVNNENDYRRAAADLIAKQLNAQGLQVTVSALPYDTYMQYLAAGYYDLFLGEVRLTDNMNLNCFFTAEGNCAFSVNPANSSTAAAYAAYLAGESELGEFVIAFKEEMPLVPVAYRKGVVAYTSQMRIQPQSTYGDKFGNIEEWTF